MSDNQVRFIRKNGRIIPIRGKKAKEEQRKRAQTQAAGSYLLGVATVKPVSSGYHDIRGMKRLYHGTSKEVGSKILKEGIKVSGKKTHAGGAAKSGYAFVSDSRVRTAAFSRVAQEAHTRGKAFDLNNPIDREKRLRVARSGKMGKVIKLDVPADVFSKKFIVDPENAELIKRGAHPLAVKFIGGDRYASKSKIPAKYVVGKFSPGKALSQMKKTFKGNKKLFGRGVGKIGFGAGLLATSGVLGYNSYKNWRQSK